LTLASLGSFLFCALQLVLLTPRQFLRLAFGFLTAQPEGNRSAAGIVVPIEINAGAPVREADLVAAASGTGVVVCNAAPSSANKMEIAVRL
jgi:hypothetical protein